jgi:vitamin B12 transporter
MQRNTLAALIAGLFTLPVQAQEAFVLDEIVVTATRIATPVPVLLNHVTVVNRETISRMGAVTLPELLGTLSGIQVTTTGGRGDPSTLSIRGGNSSHVVVLIDGQRISSATLGTTSIHALPLEQIERIEVVRGPASGLYGTDAMSGVVQIFTRKSAGTPSVTGFLGLGRYGTVIGSAGYGGSVGDDTFSLHAGLDRSEGFSSVKAASGGFFDSFNPDNDAYENKNVNAGWKHRVSQATTLGLDMFYVDALKHFDATNCDTNFFTCTANFDNKNRQQLASLQTHVASQMNERWHTRFTLGQSQDKQRNWLFDPVANTVTIDQYITTQTQAAWQNEVRVPGGKALLLAEWRDVAVDSSKAFVLTGQTTRAVTAGYQGAFGDHSVQLNARYDDISALGGHTNGSVGYGYRLTPAWSVRASVGTAFHAPSFNDLYWPLDPVNFFQGNPALRPETARNHEIGLNYAVAETRVSLTAYHNKVDNLIDFVAGSAPNFIGTMGNLNAATLKGVSLSYADKVGAWSWQWHADFLSAEDDATGRTLQRRAPRTGGGDVGYTQGNLSVHARVQATSSRYNNAANTQKLAGYAVLDLDARYKLDRNWTLEGKLSNVFDKDYTLVSTTIPPANIYAVPGRGLFVGLRYSPK